MTKTIIVPFPHPDQDPERIAATAIPMARLLAEASGGSVLLVSAVDIMPRFDPLARRLSVPSEELRASLLQEASDALAEVAAEFGEVPVETSVVWGHPVGSLVELVEQIEHPILVVGSRGRRGLNRTLYGSVALSLVHEVSCPVLVIQGLAVAADIRLPHLTRMVVPLDRSRLSEEALAAAATLLEPGQATLHLIHVIEIPPGLREWPVHEVPTVEQHEARKYLEDQASVLLDQGHKVSIEVRVGRPADEIIAVAARQRAGLIAMATHGRSGFSRLVFGSVAERVLQQSRSPLLLIRPEVDAVEEARTAAKATQESFTARIPGPKSTTPTLWNLTAKDIMRPLPIVACEDTPASKIVKYMLDFDIGCIPVVGSRGELVGIVSESDFVGTDQDVPMTAFQVPHLFKWYLSQDAVADIYAAGEDFTAEQIMSHEVVAVSEDQSVTVVARKLLSPHIRWVLVHRNGIPVGIIAERDLMKLLVPGAAKRVADG